MINTTNDLLGKKFGRLVVIEKMESNIDSSGATRSNWKCQCECGNTKKASGRHLKRGSTKSCGCLKKENGKKWGASLYK